MPAKQRDGATESLTTALLARTSRTFALSIPLLPEPTRSAVSLAYLWFRIVDTLEDAPGWSRDERTRALNEFAELALAPSSERARASSSAWLSRGPTIDAGCRDLLEASPLLIEELERCSPEVREAIFTHCHRTALGMREVLAAADAKARFRLTQLRQLRAYCYVVAGIVGELLTVIFVHDAPGLLRVKSILCEHEAAFGEGLQLVNVLKDELEDQREGRVYLPADVPRKAVFALARADLERARCYIQALEHGGAPRGIVAFTELPARLADAALDCLEQRGPGAKVPRPEVLRILESVQHSATAAHSASAQSGK